MDLAMLHAIQTQPNKGQLVHVQVALPTDIHRRLKVAAALTGRTMIQVLVDLIEAHLPPAQSFGGGR